jgi:L-ascorbate metabolism protein UlaG (beta-lactamase superfamily)
MPTPPLPEPSVLERMKELDHEHRKRLRGAVSLTLSMRFLAAAFERLHAGTDPVRAAPVPRPGEGTVSVTFVGHATVMITTPRTRILTDPLLERALYGLRRAKAAGVDSGDVADVDLVLVSHAHRDHLSRKSLRRLPGAASVVVPPQCGSLLHGMPFVEVVELAPGQERTHGDVTVTAVPVRHSGARGLGDYARRGACGYVIRAGHACLYFAGDTGYFSGFAEIGRRFQPDVALLPIAGYEPTGFREEHLSPLDAVYAFEDLRARILIPISYGSFPLSYEPLDAPAAWLKQLARERGLASAPNGAGSDRPRVVLLDHGQTIHLHRPTN